MKHPIFIGILFLAVLFSGCEKIPFDARNKYCGDYLFSYSYYSWSGSSQSATIQKEYMGRVYYNKADSKSTIHLAFSETEDFECTIDKVGNLKKCGGDGRFESKDKLSFYYSSHMCPGQGLGGGVVYTISGQKE